MKKFKETFDLMADKFLEKAIDNSNKKTYNFAKNLEKVSDLPLINSSIFIKDRYRKRTTGLGFLSFFLCFLFFIMFVFCISPTRGISMDPTISDNSVVFGVRLGTPWAPYPKRGEIWSTAVIGEGMLVKRMVGIQGDHLEINEENRLMVNSTVIKGYPVVDPFYDLTYYINSYLKEDAENEKVRFFMLGDNYTNSLDSRIMGTFSLAPIGYKIYTIDEVKENLKNKIERLNIF